jgi:hypothetical protein
MVLIKMFTSGFHFQQSCKWNLDNRYPIRKWRTIFELKNGDSVFLKVSDIPYFVSLNLPKRVSLVVHNSDESFTDELYDMVKSYVTSVRAVNCVTPRAIQLPLGLRDDQYTPHAVLRDVMNAPDVKRDILCVVNFLIYTNTAERQYVYDLFKSNPHCLVQHDYMYYHKSMSFSDEETQTRRKEFYNTLKRSKYAICPAGTGIDTHRVYECIHLGVIPIVKSSPLDSLYATMPVKIVNDWESVIPWLEQESRQHTQLPDQ